MSGAAHSNSDRLWPVLTVLVLLLGSAIALEVYARMRDPQAIVIAIRNVSVATLSNDETGDGDDGEVEADPQQPLDPEHAAARAALRRGDVPGAISALIALITAKPSEPVLLADLGYAQLLGDDPRAAVASLQRATQLGSDSPYAYLNLGVGLRRTGEVDAALSALEHALARKPDFRSARLAKASVLRRLRRFDESVAILEELAKSGGNSARAEALLALGRTRLAQQKPAEAESAFEHAIEWAPSAAELRISIARAYLATDNKALIAKGRAAAEVAAQMAPDLAAVHSTLARAKELAGDEEGAYEAYQAALRLSPEYHHVRRRLLRLALDRRDFSTARAHAERLLASQPQEPEHHFLAGLVEARAGNLDGARSHYEAAIDAAADHYPEACFNLGLIERQANHLPDAVAAYQRALLGKPDYLAAYNNLGLAHVAAHSPKEAETAYQAALALDPSYAPALVNLGKLRMAQDRFADAAQAFERAVAARHDSPEALLNLGVAYRKAGDLQRAIKTYRALLAAQPRYVAAYYDLGIALERAHDAAGAKQAYEQALALDAEHGPARRRLAKLLVAQGDQALAKQHYQALVDSDPTDRRAWLGIAELNRMRGDVAGCLRAVNAAVAGADDKQAKDSEALRERCKSRA